MQLAERQPTMRLRRDRRTFKEQAKSGLMIAGALLASLAALMLIAIAYDEIVKIGGTHRLAGWLLMISLGAVLVLTAQHWSRWFYFLPGYIAMRSAGWLLLGWFSARGFIFISFPLLISAMAVLSFRYSKLKALRVIDRAVLMIALACLLGSFSGLHAQPKASVLGFAALGDLVLWLARLADNHRKTRKNRTDSASLVAIPE